MNLASIRPFDAQEDKRRKLLNSGWMLPPEKDVDLSREVGETARIAAEFSEAKANMQKRMAEIDDAIRAIKADIVELESAKTTTRHLVYAGYGRQTLEKWLKQLTTEMAYCEMTFGGTLDADVSKLWRTKYCQFLGLADDDGMPF